MIKGYVKDSKGMSVEGANVELKDKNFQTKIRTTTNDVGYFEIKEKNGFYPFMTVVKNYGIDFLEFWGLNIDLSNNHLLDIIIGENEIYGTNVFIVDGTTYPVFIYIRPMNLTKFKLGAKDIAPKIAIDNISIKVNNKTAKILSLQKIKETINIKGEALTAYLIQLKQKSPLWDKIEVKISANDTFGMALIYNR